MEVNLSDALPLLRTILRQHDTILERLESLVLTLKHEPEPVEPTLRALLKPLHNGLSEAKDTLSRRDSGAASSTSAKKA
nr:hypothetical protein [Dyella ginsengisoli]